jgi:ABC-2 type transport system ATP-binding protein
VGAPTGAGGATAALAVEAVGVTKTYRTGWRRRPVEALRGVDLRVAAGGVVGLVGPNGSGKSTLLKVLVGLVRASGGAATVLGAPSDAAAARVGVGYAPEQPGLPPALSPREVLDLHGRLHGFDHTRRVDAAGRWLDALDLAAVADRPCRTLSTGQARRVALARALCTEPRLCILDEPTAGLDPLGVRQLATLLADRRAHGMAILFASHMDTEVEQLAERLTVLWDGRVAAEGPAGELLAAPDRWLVHAPGLAPDAGPALCEWLRGRGARAPQLAPARRAIADLLEQARG